MVEKKVFASREEWLQARNNRIGGSDAAAIIGLNPYMSNVDLWEIKTGRNQQEDISEKPYVKYGTEAEKYLRELFKLDHPEYTVFYEENNMFFNDAYPWAHASLDGWLKGKDDHTGIWECKTTNILNSHQKEKWDNRIPDNYYCQILHYFMVTEFEFAILKAQLKYDYGDDVMCVTKHYRIERTEVEQDIRYLAEKEKEFWKHVEEDRKPTLILPRI